MNMTPEEKEFYDLWMAYLPPFVARDYAERLTGGLIQSPKTLRNMDCEGQGPKELWEYGQQVMYPRQALIEFMLQSRRVRCRLRAGQPVEPPKVSRPTKPSRAKKPRGGQAA